MHAMPHAKYLLTCTKTKIEFCHLLPPILDFVVFFVFGSDETMMNDDGIRKRSHENSPGFGPTWSQWHVAFAAA
jgi:hypothetical protein